MLIDFRLSIAAKRMAAQNVLVKDLQGVETLGMLFCGGLTLKSLTLPTRLGMILPRTEGIIHLREPSS